MASLFQGGFGKFLSRGTFSDVTLIVGRTSPRERYRAHRIILATSSEFFRRLLLGEFKESTQYTIELKYPDPDHVFPILLQFMYTGTVDLTSEIAIPLLSMADHYLVPDLQRACFNYIGSRIHRDNVLAMLEKAASFDAEDTVEKCLRVIAKNFRLMAPGTDFSSIEPVVFLKLVAHRNFTVKSEYVLYTTICNYIMKKMDKLSPQTICDIMGSIRFRFFTAEQLLEAVSNPLVPREFIIEAVMFKLQKLERPDLPIVMTQRLQPRRAQGIQFEHTHDFDEQGVLHWIATDGLQEKWRNPHDMPGGVKVTASSLERGQPRDLVEKLATQLWTKDVPASWFCLDLGPSRSVLLSKYTLRHGMKFKADSLRTWDLQGSKDGKQWVLLMRHAGDCSLNEGYATHTWAVVGMGTLQTYRYFRILQTSYNSSRHNFLVLSGIELYGELYENAAPDE
ncbi:E3 ubiquitin-protein ligase Ufd4 [Pelomyxa schiedti]|nr:E3 ubiquitin-protein ligase Ufd4 [Pelomyxa schiedti]